MKKLISSTLSLVMVFFAGGCGIFGLNETTAINGKEQVTLRVAWWGEQPRHDDTLKVIELFEKKYPYIKIEPEYTNWDDYWKKLAPMAAGNKLPDIIQMDLLYLRPYSENNLLEDLTPFINEKTIKTDSISKMILSGGKIGDKVYGVPLGLNAPAIILDRTLLLSAGVSFPKSNWSWNDFENLALQVNDRKQIYGTNGMKPPEVFFSYFLRTKGKSLYNASGTGLGYEDDQMFVDYFEMQLRLLEQGAFPRPDVTEQIKGIQDELLVNQQSAVTWAHSNQYIGFTKSAKRTLELIQPPGYTQDMAYTVKPSMLFSVSKSSKNKQAAALFINFFVNSSDVNRMIKGERGVPISSKVVKNITNDLTEQEKKVFDYVNKVKNKNVIVEKADPVGGIEVVKLLQNVSDQILFKKITPSEGAQIFRTNAAKILSQNG
ncbi:ABC transporter substrate-binding protein [Neobacillus dielmonensis]|uniref:ABC transporter substrate-binding protein n=1 Tax=Neobacillus dielmonensis TaxID=1347369 RepID=UPI0005A87B77|nr:ABC transporter substrate-binding protein [Neobacillus dielmonensis]